MAGDAGFLHVKVDVPQYLQHKDGEWWFCCNLFFLSPLALEALMLSAIT
jgi:hypothetical protein